jgi:electron transport complex protein RnfE
VISLIKSLIPDKVRIPAYVVVIATFVSVVEMVMQAYVPRFTKAWVYSFR